jgi:hypothetical protein
VLRSFLTTLVRVAVRQSTGAPQLPLTGNSVHAVIGHLPEAKGAKFARDIEIGFLVEE